MIINNSPDINNLSVKLIIDLSGSTPSIKVVNQCTGPHLTNVKIAFELYDPNNNPIHTGSLPAGDVLGNFTDFTFTEPIPQFDTAILFSGSPYRLVVKAIDSTPTTFTMVPELTADICRPAGNLNVGQNYAEGDLKVEIDCNKAEAKITDLSVYTYRGITGTILSKKITIVSPADATGEVPDPIEYDGYSAILHTLTQSGKGFFSVLSTKIQYDLDKKDGTGNVFLILRFVKSKPFTVNCGYDLCPILAEFGRLLKRAETDCRKEDEDKVRKLTPYIVELVLADKLATCDSNVGKMIDHINNIAGWNFNCRTQKIFGLNGTGSQGDLNVQFETDGDITASAAVAGQNITITIKDFSYVFNLCEDNESNAFTITPSVSSGRVKRSCLSVKLVTLSQEILNTIQDNADLLLQLRTMVGANGQFILSVDPLCIPTLTPRACAYTLTALTIPADTTFALFDSIVINGNNISINQLINGTVASRNALTATLNALNLGTFAVAFTGPGTLTISTTNNPNEVTEAFIYSTVLQEVRIPVSVLKNCSGTGNYPANQLIQAILKYLCNISAKQVKIGDVINVCHPGEANNPRIKQFQPNSDVYAVIKDMTDAQCEALDLILKSTGLNCDILKKIFIPEVTAVPNDTTIFFGNTNDRCDSVTMPSLVDYIWQKLKEQEDFCTVINQCGIGGIIPPVSGFIVLKKPNGLTSGCSLAENITSLMS